MNIGKTGLSVAVTAILAGFALSACSETATEALQSAAESPTTTSGNTGASTSGSTQGSTGASTGAENPEAVLPPANRLAKDTREAATSDRSRGTPPYVGVWAASPQGCAKIDRTVYDSFAVITPTSVRQFEESCTYTSPATTSNVHQLDVACTAEGATSSRVIVIEVLNDQTIRFQNAALEGKSWEMYRCHLPRG